MLSVPSFIVPIWRSSAKTAVTVLFETYCVTHFLHVSKPFPLWRICTLVKQMQFSKRLLYPKLLSLQATGLRCFRFVLRYTWKSPISALGKNEIVEFFLTPLALNIQRHVALSSECSQRDSAVQTGTENVHEQLLVEPHTQSLVRTGSRRVMEIQSHVIRYLSVTAFCDLLHIRPFLLTNDLDSFLFIVSTARNSSSLCSLTHSVFPSGFYSWECW